jgi:hypothetical protein
MTKEREDMAEAAARDLMQSEAKKFGGKTKSKVELLPAKVKGKRHGGRQAPNLQTAPASGKMSKKSKKVTAAEAAVVAATDDEVGWIKVQEKKEKKIQDNVQINIVMRQIENALYCAKHEFILDKNVPQKYIIFHDDWGEGPRDGCTLIVYQNFSNNFNIEPFTFMVKGHVDIKHLIPEFMYSRLKYGILIKPGSAAHLAFNEVAIYPLRFNHADMIAIVLKAIILPKGTHELYKNRSDTEIMNLIKHELPGPGRKGAFVFIFDLRRNVCFHQMFHEFSQDINYGNPKLVRINPAIGYC